MPDNCDCRHCLQVQKEALKFLDIRGYIIISPGDPNIEEMRGAHRACGFTPCPTMYDAYMVKAHGHAFAALESAGALKGANHGQPE